MTSSWPCRATIHFTGSELPVRKLIVFMNMKGDFKNSFPFGPVLTDEYGNIEFSRQELLDSIEECQRESPSDYDGSLELCRELELLIEDDKQIDLRIERLRMFYPQNADRICEMAASSCNSSFEPKRVLIPIDQLSSTTTFAITLDPKT